MDFKDTPEEAIFRKECAQWLATHATPKSAGQHQTFDSLAGRISASRAWQATKAANGFGAITWPKALGGRGGSPIQEVIFREEEAKYNVPASVFNVSLGMVIPSLLMHGSDEVRARYVAPALQGKELWCQLLSEPNAGSDLGMIRTQAKRCEDGRDGWIISGQKVWTSFAQFAEFGMVLTRTDPDQAKFAGMTSFFVDMQTPGIEIRPIRQANGQEEFNEVFFNDVYVPDEQRVGDIGNGWRVTMTALMNERLSIGGVLPADLWQKLARNIQSQQRAVNDQSILNRLNEIYINAHGLWLMQCRGLTALGQGKEPGPELSVAKIIAAKTLSDYCELMMDLEGSKGLLSAAEHGSHWQLIEDLWYGAAGIRIAGGTDEIVKNNVGERVLGLPPEPRLDKGKTFRELVSN
jgi:alkylation response protein AidB-like acyl-CoA dehydrogenase